MREGKELEALKKVQVINLGYQVVLQVEVRRIIANLTIYAAVHAHVLERSDTSTAHVYAQHMQLVIVCCKYMVRQLEIPCWGRDR